MRGGGKPPFVKVIVYRSVDTRGQVTVSGMRAFFAHVRRRCAERDLSCYVMRHARYTLSRCASVHNIMKRPLLMSPYSESRPGTPNPGIYDVHPKYYADTYVLGHDKCSPSKCLAS